MAVPFISIIVPVYKAEQTLSRCLDSILVQTFTDFELLLIDDGSPDASGVICDEYALKDSRIRVFHKENGGVGSARNLGLDNARGEWICFVDSDDWIKECFLSEFCTNIDGVDMVISGYRQFGDSSEIIVFNSALYDLREKVDLGQENNAVCVFYCPWRKLFRLSIIRERRIRFPEDLFLAEDTCFILDYLCFCNRIRIIPTTSYMYYYSKKEAYGKYLMDLKNLIIHSKKLDSKIDWLSRQWNVNLSTLRYLMMSTFLSKYLRYSFSRGYKCFINNMNGLTGEDVYTIIYAALAVRWSPQKDLYYRVLLRYPRLGYFVLRLRKYIG